MKRIKKSVRPNWEKTVESWYARTRTGRDPACRPAACLRP